MQKLINRKIAKWLIVDGLGSHLQMLITLKIVKVLIVDVTFKQLSSHTCISILNSRLRQKSKSRSVYMGQALFQTGFCVFDLFPWLQQEASRIQDGEITNCEWIGRSLLSKARLAESEIKLILGISG